MPTDERPIPVRFAEFDAAHPKVYELFKMYAGQLLRAGRKKGSARAICERLRWDVLMGKAQGEEYKLNDHYIPHFARKLAAEDERFANFFEFRSLHNVVLDPGCDPLDLAQ